MSTGAGDAAVSTPTTQSKVANNSPKSAENTKANNRPRRRTNTKGDGDSQSRSNSRHNSTNGSKNQRGKEWSDRKSLSQGKGDAKNSKSEDHKRTRSSNSTSGKRSARNSARTASQASNGEGYEYSDYDLEEPFSDSEDESSRPKKPEKMALSVARGRIRTLSGTVPIIGYSPKWGGPTMCLSCLQFFDLPEQIDKFAEHLLEEHKIVVSEMNLIVDPKRYIEHWRQRFAKESVDKIFPCVEPAKGEAFHGETEYYYLMSEAVPEDYSLRQRLAMRRLEEALSCQQREREDVYFKQQCIFCRYNAVGNRSKIIHHLYMIHHLNIGSPDNLVFVAEYIDHLKQKLVRNECIYCEKVFPDRNTLMDHMRKRNHREVNPKNHYYDKFYIINYLELGKRWLDVLAEDFEDSMPTFQDSDEEEEDNEWCEWQEDNLDSDETRVVCILCEHSEDNANTLLEHLKTEHEFDFIKALEEDKLDTYQRMKLLNFIRKQTYNANCWVCQRDDIENPLMLLKHLKEHKPLEKLPEASVWDLEENLVPIFGNDHLLWMLESLFEKKIETEEEPKEDVALDKMKTLQNLIVESKTNTVEGVTAEDLPPLQELDCEEIKELKEII